MEALRRFAAGLLSAAVLAYPARARTQTTAPIELKWNALKGCPSAETVLAGVRRIAGATRAAPHTLRAEAQITQVSEGLFRLRLEIHYGALAAVRNIEGKSCKDLAGAAAVALALPLSSEEPVTESDLAAATSTGADSTGASPANGASATPPSQAPILPPANPARTPAPASTRQSEPPRRWRVLLGAPFTALSVGPTRQLSRGLGGSAGFSFDGWRFLASAGLWAPQHETTTRLGYEYEVELRRFTVAARGCRVVVGSRWELAPCALVSAHRLAVRGSGHNLVPGTDSANWAAVGVGARARLLVTSWLGLVATLDGELQLSRPEVNLSLPPADSREPTPVPTPVVIERLAPAVATATVGAEWIF
jgi:hypothetical protein